MEDLKRVLASIPLSLEQSFKYTTVCADVDKLSCDEAKVILKQALLELAKKQNMVAALAKEIIAKDFDQIGY